jgi:hypothetical protein
MRKDNVAVKTMILNKLSEVEYTHTYALALRDGHIVKAALIEDADEILPLITYAEYHDGKKHHGWAVRMNNCKASFDIMKAYAREIVDICTIEELEREYAENGKAGSNNRGHIFEQFCAETLGGVQNKSKIEKCINSGDIVVNGEHIQCKFWNATVTTEESVNNFIRRKREQEQE